MTQYDGVDITTSVSDGIPSSVVYEGVFYVKYGGVVSINGRKAELGDFPKVVQDIFLARGLCSVALISKKFQGATGYVLNE